MLMFHKECGWHNATSIEAEEMKKNGWVESSLEEHAKIVANKHKKTDNVNQSEDEAEGTFAIPSGNQAEPRRRGRKPRGG